MMGIKLNHVSKRDPWKFEIIIAQYFHNEIWFVCNACRRLKSCYVLLQNNHSPVGHRIFGKTVIGIMYACMFCSFSGPLTHEATSWPRWRHWWWISTTEGIRLWWMISISNIISCFFKTNRCVKYVVLKLALESRDPDFTTLRASVTFVYTVETVHTTRWHVSNE